MVYLTNLLIIALVIAICSADTWLWLALIRLVLDRITAEDNPFSNALKCLTDPLPEHLRRLIAKWGDKVLPPWMLWLISFAGLIALRYSLFQFMIRI